MIWMSKEVAEGATDVVEDSGRNTHRLVLLALLVHERVELN